MCSKFPNHSKFISQHHRGAIPDRFMTLALWTLKKHSNYMGAPKTSLDCC